MHKLTSILFALLFSLQCFSQSLQLDDIRCEYKVNPLGIDITNPRFSWKIKSSERSVTQTAYRILVSDDPAKLKANTGNIWDSKKVTSAASIQVQFSGKPLKAANTYFWKVMIWDDKGRSTSWSNAGSFQMGLLEAADWKGAKWIAYERLPDSLVYSLVTDRKKDQITTNNVLPVLRKNFAIKKKVKKASAFISGLGHFELSLNGKKVGDHFLDAGWAKYDKEALYVSFDITDQVKNGANAIGVMLGNGFYYVPPVKGRFRKLKTSFGYPKMITRIFLEYTDGTTENIISDHTWKTSKSPVVFSSIYGGEDYDATLEQKGWDTPSFNDKSWKSVLIVEGPPKLHSQMAEPLKVFENFVPVKTSTLENGNLVFDLGQNASGIIEIKVKGKKGDTVRVAPGELLTAEGAVTQRATGGPFYFTYILKGDGEETWKPRFTYYGFRYLEVKRSAVGHTPKTLPQLIAIKGLHTRNAAPGAGAFSSSNEVFSKTDKLIGRRSRKFCLF